MMAASKTAGRFFQVAPTFKKLKTFLSFVRKCLVVTVLCTFFCIQYFFQILLATIGEASAVNARFLGTPIFPRKSMQHYLQRDLSKMNLTYRIL